MAAESLTRSSAINLINGSIDSFMFSHACYCTSNMESLSEDDIELYDQMHEVISILNDDEDYRHDLETMPLEDLKEFLLMCRKNNGNLIKMSAIKNIWIFISQCIKFYEQLQKGD